MNSLGPKVIQTHLPSIKNPSSKSIIRQSRSTICFCNSDDSGSSSSSSSSEGDKRKQELLARIMMLQTQKVRLTDFLDERSDYLTQFAEDANAEFDEIGNKAMKELDEAGDRIMEKLEGRMQAWEESAGMSREEIERNEKVVEEFEEQIDKDRNEGLFFKNLGDKSPEGNKRTPEAKLAAEKVKDIAKESAGSKLRKNIYLGLMLLLAYTIASGIFASNDDVEWGKITALVLIFIGLVAQFVYEQSLCTRLQCSKDGAEFPYSDTIVGFTSLFLFRQFIEQVEGTISKFPFSIVSHAFEEQEAQPGSAPRKFRN